MSKKRISSGLVLLSLVVAASTVACTAGPGRPELGVRPVTPAAKPKLGGLLTGRVVAPSTLISNNSAGLISNNSAGVGGKSGLISNNSAGSTGARTGGFRVQALSQNALARTEVFLADASGKPIPDLPSAVTDANGNFKFDNVPPGFTLMVVAKGKNRDDGKDAQLKTIVKTDAAGATADISAASTLVTAFVAKDKQGALGSFSATQFEAAVQTTGKHLSDSNLPNFAEPALVVAKMESLSNEVSALRTQLTGLKEELSKANATIEQLQAEIEALKAGGSAPSGVTPSDSGPAPVASFAPASPLPSPTADPNDRTRFAFNVGGAPGAMAYDASANLWVAIGDKLAKLPTSVAAPAATTVDVGSQVAGLAVNTDGKLIVADKTGKVLKLNADGSGKETVVDVGEAIFELALDAEGNIWVVTATKAAKYSHAGSLVGAYTLRKAETTHAAIAFDASGNALVQGLGDLHADKLGKSDARMLWWGRSAFTYDPATAAAPAYAGIAADSAGNVWASSYLSNQVVKFDTDGKAVGAYGVDGSPGAIAFDSTGNLWVALTNADKVVKLSSAGAVQATYRVGAKPADLLIAPGGRVWVSNNKGASVTFIDP